ncbi:ATP-dependent DNA ligase [Paenibacillus sp. CC-CFT747]|nr:ATP-dependent DNA ligase [Paenibacillus sp. CC-CFT747]
MEKWINPMQCAAEDVPFADEHYLFEPKIDGHRLLLYSGRDGTRLYDGSGQPLNALYPEWTMGMEEGMILDGEAAAVGEDGRSICFETVMKRRRAAPAEATGLAVRYPAQYIVFDILQYRGRDLRGLPLAKRKEILASIDFSGSPAIGLIPFMEEHGDLLYEEIRRRGWEGMVAKKLSSMYISGRSEAWRKVIFWQETEVAITGIRKRDRGWLASVPSPPERSAR